MTQRQPDSEPRPLVRPFPRPVQLVALAYRELDVADTGTDEQRKELGDIGMLPRPWDPASCVAPGLRAELWTWLDAVVTWINHEYVFDPVDTIPSCWPQHPHLVNEIAVLADQRRRAGYAYTSDALEEWHRYNLPAFLERMRRRVADHCQDIHPPTWPAAGRFARHLSDIAAQTRWTAFHQDVTALRDPDQTASPTQRSPRLTVVDTDTGEILD